MNLDESPEELDARTAVEAAVQRLGHALVGHRIDPDLARRVASVATALADEAEVGARRDRAAELAASARLGVGRELSPAPAIDPDGGEMDFFRDSVVSGRTNPLGIGVRVVRVGDAAVGTVALGPAHEGAPRRAHGGVLAAIFDEVMGFTLSLVASSPTRPICPSISWRPRPSGCRWW